MIYRCRWQVELLFKELKLIPTGEVLQRPTSHHGRIGLGQFAGIDHPQVHRDAKRYAIRVGTKPGRMSMFGCYRFWRPTFIKHGRK